MTLVAANGDEVHLTYAGTCDPLPPSVGETLTCNTDSVIVGGTGRFANATGEAQVTGVVTYAGIGVPVWPVTWTLGRDASATDVRRSSAGALPSRSGAGPSLGLASLGSTEPYKGDDQGPSRSITSNTPA